MHVTLVYKQIVKQIRSTVLCDETLLLLGSDWRHVTSSWLSNCGFVRQ